MTPIRGKTERGTVVEVKSEKGCGLLLVQKPGDDSLLVCHVTALAGVTPEDVTALRWLSK